MIRPIACILLGLGFLDALTIDVEESKTGVAGAGGDVAELERVAVLERARLVQARAELDRLPKAIARLARQDIGASETELDRIAVNLGKTIIVDRCIYIMDIGRFSVQSGQRRIDIDTVTRTMSEDLGAGAAPRVWRLEPSPKPIPVEDGKPGDPVLGRATVRFGFTADSRTYVVLVDPTIVNPYAHLNLVGVEPSQKDSELARLPGFPLLIVEKGDRFEGRWMALEIK